MADWVSYAVEGYIGDPRRATVEKGRRLFEGWVARVAQLLEEIRSDQTYERVISEFYERASYGGSSSRSPARA